MPTLSSKQIAKFQARIWDYYQQHGRLMPWRNPAADGEFNAYHILISELMLQQTQVSRVIPKFELWIERFPTVESLAAAEFSDVLQTWSGLGYNRRARYAFEAAQQLASQPRPWSYQQLLACPGIGPNTAAAIYVYTCNKPHYFIETNIRTVYIDYFFAGASEVTDKEIHVLLEQTIPDDNPREFYWGLMDYGAHLKGQGNRVARKSRHYAKQTTFEGSKRQLRGRVLRILQKEVMTMPALIEALEDERTPVVLDELVKEQLIQYQNGRYYL